MCEDLVIILTPKLEYFIETLNYDRPVDLLNINGQSFLERIILTIENKQIIVVISEEQSYYDQIFSAFSNVKVFNTKKQKCSKIDQLFYALKKLCCHNNTVTVMESNMIINPTLLNNFFKCNKEKKYMVNESVLGPITFPISTSHKICEKIESGKFHSFKDLINEIIDNDFFPFKCNKNDLDQIVSKDDYFRVLNAGYSRVKNPFLNKTNFISFPPMKKFVGVYDVIGAQLAQLMGFDGLWLGSYQISLSLGIQDDETYNPNVAIKLCQDLTNARVMLPIIIDIGNGFVEESSIADFAEYCNRNPNIIAICIDDNQSVRDNSMLSSKRRILLTTYEFKVRINKLKKFFRKDMLFIARTEIIIADQENANICEINEKCHELLSDCADIFLPHYVGNNITFFKTIFNNSLKDYITASIPSGLIGLNASFFEKMKINILVYANIDIRYRIKILLKIFPDICSNTQMQEFNFLPSADKIKELIDLFND